MRHIPILRTEINMDSATLFKLINEFIIALASLLWPIVTLIVVLVFRSDLAALLKRVRKGKILGQEMELDSNVIAFQNSVKEAQEEIPESDIANEKFKKESDETDESIKEVLDAASSNPELGIIKLSSVLEREIRALAGSLGQTPQRRMTATHLFHALVEKGYFPQHTTRSLQIFWDLRNKIVHGHEKEDERNVIKVLDAGLALLKTIKSIPHEINIVYHPGVPIYRDENCEDKISDAKGLILETTSPGGAEKFQKIFPTTNSEYYTKGKRVSWEWDLSRVWNKAWYKDPDTGEIKTAWYSSGEFNGRSIEDL